MQSRLLYFKTIDSPVGKLKLMASEKGLCGVFFETERGVKLAMKVSSEQADNHPLLLRAEKQLGEYFAGTRKQFDLPIDMNGSVFQQKAWRQLQTIPYAATISYGEQAKRMGDANKARAVGMANGRNPVSIVVPCHRVVGASGSLTGFGGGLKAKQYLLELEKKHAA